MAKFEVLQIWSGWTNAQTPDNLEIRLKTGKTTHDMYASLREVIELYYRIENRREGDMPIGTGNFVELERMSAGKNTDADQIRLSTPPISRVFEGETLESSVRSLVTEAFEAHNRMDETEVRDEELGHIQDWITRHELHGDVRELYAELMADGES